MYEKFLWQMIHKTLGITLVVLPCILITYLLF